MASPLAHAALAGVLGGWAPAAYRSRGAFWLLAVACALLPDIDHLWLRSGPRYHEWAHFGVGPVSMLIRRGITHSLSFAALAGAAAALLLRPSWRDGLKLAALLVAVTASHGALDGFTDGDLGVAYFAPFSRARYLFPWRPIVQAEGGLLA
jgi:inner membrane protein